MSPPVYYYVNNARLSFNLAREAVGWMVYVFGRQRDGYEALDILADTSRLSKNGDYTVVFSDRHWGKIFEVLLRERGVPISVHPHMRDGGMPLPERVLRPMPPYASGALQGFVGMLEQNWQRQARGDTTSRFVPVAVARTPVPPQMPQSARPPSVLPLPPPAVAAEARGLTEGPVCIQLRVKDINPEEAVPLLKQVIDEFGGGRQIGIFARPYDDDYEVLVSDVQLARLFIDELVKRNVTPIGFGRTLRDGTTPLKLYPSGPPAGAMLTEDPRVGRRSFLRKAYAARAWLGADRQSGSASDE